MLKVIDLVYYSHNDTSSLQDVLNIHAPATGFAAFIKDRVNIEFVKHLNNEGTETINGIKYSFFKNRNNFWHIPFKTHHYIKSHRPDIILVEGLIFPLQLMALKIQLGRKTKILVQHHGEKPFKGIKRLFQRFSARFTDRYLFTAKENASDWINKKIIKQADNCSEVLEASTYFTKLDKRICQDKLGINGHYNFLWVGSLDNNKDPLTMLNAFEKYVVSQPAATLYMIYKDGKLLKEVKNKIESSLKLIEKVKLIGYVEHAQLSSWYSAANFYISCSYKEGSGYALLEAMACGCIPVVTSIPSFKKMTGDGRYGFLYTPGDAETLTTILKSLQNINTAEYSSRVQHHFAEKLSFKNIADDLYHIFDGIEKNR